MINKTNKHLHIASRLEASSSPMSIIPTHSVQPDRLRSAARPLREGSIVRYYQPVKPTKRKPNGFALSPNTPSLVTKSSSSSQLQPKGSKKAALNTNPASIRARKVLKKNLVESSVAFANNSSIEPKSKRSRTDKAAPKSLPKQRQSKTAAAATSLKVTGPIAPTSSDSSSGISFTTPSLRWKQRHSTLLVLTTTNPEPRIRPGTKKIAIAAFDLDSTIVRTKSLTPFPKDGSDWEWFNDSVESNLKAFIQDQYGKTQPNLLTSPSVSPPLKEFLSQHPQERVPYMIAILSNQGGVVIKNDAKRYGHFRERLEQIAAVCHIPFWMYAATRPLSVKKVPGAPPPQKKPDPFRKPATGMWLELLADVKKLGCEVDHARSFYVGDAAGRKNDFSDSDREMAKALKLKFFTPEDFFINNPPPKRSNRRTY